MEKIRARDAAPTLGMSLSGFYRAVKRNRAELAGHIDKDAGGMFISAEGLKILTDLVQPQVNQGQPESTSGVDQVNQGQSPVIQALEKSIAILESQVDSQERTISALLEERRRADHLLAGTMQELTSTRLQLEDLRQKNSAPPAPRKAAVVPIRPVEPSEPHPMASWSPLQLMMIKFFQPWKLRRDYRDKKAA